MARPKTWLLLVSLLLSTECAAFSRVAFPAYNRFSTSKTILSRFDTSLAVQRQDSAVVWEEIVYGEAEEEVSGAECPRGYFLDSVNNCCTPLGPLGKMSQFFETIGPLKRAYSSISNLFGIDTKRISSLGVPFLLSYSIVSQIHAALMLSLAWYMSCKRVRIHSCWHAGPHPLVYTSY
jgi:hypothetical protein